MKTLVLASSNEHKVKEFKKILNDFNIITMKEIGFNDDIEENGETARENALIKAEAIHKFCEAQGLKYYVVADDTGLCVNALNGAPGVYSARYAGGHGNSEANRNKVLKELEGKADRSAYFNCAIALISPNGRAIEVEGQTDGVITAKPEGDNGFGYDSIFFSNDLGKTFAVASEEEKNSVSHRGRALEKLLKEIDNI